MFKAGKPEIDAVAGVIRSGRLFRYNDQSECVAFEKRYAKYLGVKYATMTSSGTTALTAAMAGLGLGPGDEVIVPACTYMATAVAVLAVGAIPVIVDIDESITIDPVAVDNAVGPRTRAVAPVHMWGLPCDMDAIARIARRRKLLVIEDACQAVGGGYEGRKLGAIGHAGAFSFNYFNNMTCGEGGAVVTNDKEAADRAFCTVDCCSFYWKGRKRDIRPFASNGARASEIEGAMMNVQLDRIDAWINAARRQKKRILRETAATGLTPAKANSLDYECGTHVMYLLPSAEKADAFAGKTGRHVYTEWHPILEGRGSHHPALDPFNLPQNRRCRRKYSRDMCRRSLHILGRAVMLGTNVDSKPAQVAEQIRKIRSVAVGVLRGA